MKNFKIIISLVFLLVLGVFAYSFFKDKNLDLKKEFSIDISSNTKRLINTEDITLASFFNDPQIPSYNLPLDLNNVSNWKDISQKIKLSPEAENLLKINGFTVFPTPTTIDPNEADDFSRFYKNLKYKDIPVFITTDSLLHYYHIFFDTALMKMERDIFYDDIWQITKSFYDDAITIYNSSSGDLKEAAKRNIAYLSVVLKLLEPKADQIMSDETLREEYCSDERIWCDDMIKGVKETYGENASYKYFSNSEVEKYFFEIPFFVKDLVEKEISFIEEHEGWKFSPIFSYKEDYSQYVPRGHYTQSEKLKNYFKTMMWYGRMTALIEGSPYISDKESFCTDEGLISEYNAKIQTIQASLLANKFLNDKNIQEKWSKMYSITGFFVGFSDDLGPYEYSMVLNEIFKEGADSEDIEKNYFDIQEALSSLTYNPKIYGGLGQCELFMSCPPLSEEEIDELKFQAQKLLSKTKGFRMMGQRFTVDSWLFSELVSPYSGEYNGEDLSLPTNEKPFTFSWYDNYAEFRENRPFTWVKTEVKSCPSPAMREVKGFPIGLDIMALFGSKRAEEIITELGEDQYSDYQEKFSILKKDIDSFETEDYFQNLYWNWLYVLKSLLTEVKEGNQTFMQTEAWQDKQLNTALASWAELRHDTILYVKQSYTMAEMGTGYVPPIVGYVEPMPEFYARLLDLTEMTKKGLKSLLSQEEMENLKIENALSRFSEILVQLKDISEKELKNKTLNDNEYYFIENFGKTSEYLIETMSGGTINKDILKTTMVADVHTEGNTGKVLEEGVGYIKTMLAAYKHPDGHILIGAGPVFSYYEFKQPMTERLTDETWREMLKSEHPLEPIWTKSFSE